MNALQRIAESLKRTLRRLPLSARRMPGKTWSSGLPTKHMKTLSEDSKASNESSMTDAEPGDAPIAVDSPHAFKGFADQRGSPGSRAWIQVGAGGWMIALTVVSSVSLTALLILGMYLPSYIDAKIQAGIADANATARLARAEASVARDKVEDLRVELGKKGIAVPALDGH